jgi:pimeloyl-ACP methyl ester carboxylesterase
MNELDYNRISNQFRHRKETVWEVNKTIEFGDGDLYNLKYVSENRRYLLGHSSYMCNEHHNEDGKKLMFGLDPVTEHPKDPEIQENVTFRYPLLRERSSLDALHRHDRVTIVLHGLNERQFDRYFRWAYRIWQGTDAPVVIFPLTFSINRVFPGWLSQNPKTFEVRENIPFNENTSLYNATISERLGSRPERFFWGGEQSYRDLIDFVRQIYQGEHPHFARKTRVDFLGYSSGGYIAPALLLNNPEELFNESRACVFASCVAIRYLSPSSPYIIDSMGETALRKLLVTHLDTQPSERMKHWLEEHPEGQWMRSFCGFLPDRTEREKGLKKIAPRLLGIANTNDKVMPLEGMLNALQGVRRDTGVRVEELDLGVHENPFAYKEYPNPNHFNKHDYRREKHKFSKVFLNEELFGSEYEQFIDWIVKHLK